MKTKFCQNNSFTLIELVISLAILAVVMFLLLPLLYQGIRLWQFDRDSEFALKEARLALMRMGDEISQADAIVSDGVYVIQFRPPGSSDTIVFQHSIDVCTCGSTTQYCRFGTNPNCWNAIIKRDVWINGDLSNPNNWNSTLLFYLKGTTDDLKFSYYYQGGLPPSPNTVRGVKFEFEIQQHPDDPIHHFETAVGLRNFE